MKEKQPVVSWLLFALGLFNALVGAFAYALPEAFFESVAAHTGPFNAHLTRDVGAAYLTAGAALIWGAGARRWRAPLTTAAGGFLTLHAAIHVYEAAAGHLDARHMVEEAFTVVLPAAVVCGLAVWFLRRDGREL